jgi:hypothetical protein
MCVSDTRPMRQAAQEAEARDFISVMRPATSVVVFEGLVVTLTPSFDARKMARVIARGSWMLSALALFAISLAACGADEAAPERPAHLTSLARDLRCSERPEIGTDGVAAAVGCAFQQQTHNIRANGAPISSNPVTMMDAAGNIDAKLTHACGEWLLGTDNDGADVVIQRWTGEVRSHGTLHAGQPVSALPSVLPVPLVF